MVTNNNTWTSNWVYIDELNPFPTPPPVPTPTPPPNPADVYIQKVRSVQQLIKEEMEYAAKKRSKPDPYTDPDVFI